MNALEKAHSSNRALVATIREAAVRLKASGHLPAVMSSGATGQFGAMLSQQRYEHRYGLFRGWTYSVINAVADAAAGQPVNIGRISRRRTPGGSKAYLLSKMTKTIRAKAARSGVDVIENHPILESLEHPNPFQYRYQFVYSFIANLLLTGWSYVVRDKVKGKLQFASLPTTWITPEHDENQPFARFVIRNPNSPNAAGEKLDRGFVAFACLPNPGDPLSAMSPTGAQMAAIRIDDNIQTCQEQFFRNGVFPSVVITVGREPHPDVPASQWGRPRLTQEQRRQIYAVIQRTMAGVHNYGNPAIIDALIERIDRLSATQEEIGWDRSEQAVRARILSAFGVHPFILGEAMVGSYAQAYIVEERFGRRINSYLDMLSTLMTNFIATVEGDEDLVVWWDRIESQDPSLQHSRMQSGRAVGDVTRDEYRAYLGLPPAEEKEPPINPQLLVPITQLLAQAGMGAIAPEQVESLLIGVGVPEEVAKGLTAARAAGVAQQQPPMEQQAVEQAVEELKRAAKMLRTAPDELAKQIAESCALGTGFDGEG